MKRLISVILILTLMITGTGVAFAQEISAENIISEDITETYDAEEESCVPGNEQFTEESTEQSVASEEVQLQSTSDGALAFNSSLFTSFNTVTGPISENGANEPKFSYNSFLSENVSEYSGELTLNFNDLVLKGRNGLDLRIGRSYQTVAASPGEKELIVTGRSENTLYQSLINSPSTYLLDRYNLGLGWGFNFPSVQIETEEIPLSDESSEETEDAVEETKELYYHSGNGEVYQVEFTDDTTDSNLKKYYKKDIQFNQNDTGYTNGQVTSYYSLTLPDKTKQYFAEDGRLLGIVDRFGNTIKFEHQLMATANRIPDGNFKYTDTMWEVSNGVIEENTSVSSLDDYVLHLSSGTSTLKSQAIHVTPNTEYELALRVKNIHPCNIKIDLQEYKIDRSNSIYPQESIEFQVTGNEYGEWYDYKTTFTSSADAEFVVLDLSTTNESDTYIDYISVCELNPLISKITDSIGRTINFSYQGDIYSDSTNGSVTLTVTSPGNTETRVLTYNKERVEFKSIYMNGNAQRLYWYLKSSNTEGPDGESVKYEYKGGTTTDENGNLVYPELNFHYTASEQYDKGGHVHKPLLSAVLYKDRKIVYEYEKVRKWLGTGFEDTLRVNKKYDMYAYTPEGSNTIQYKGETGTVEYSYSCQYGLYPVDNETGYPYVYAGNIQDDGISFNWSTSRFTDDIINTTEFHYGNELVSSRITSAEDISMASNYYYGNTTFFDSPTEVHTTVAENGSGYTTYTLYTYDLLGNVATVTQPVDSAIKGNSELLEKYTTSYQYHPTYNFVTQTSYYNNVDGPIINETNTYDSSGRLTASQNGAGEETKYYYENTDKPYLLTKAVLQNPTKETGLTAGNKTVTYNYDAYGLYPTTVTEIYGEESASVSSTYDYITGNVLSETYADGSSTQYSYYSDGKIKTVIYPKVQYPGGKTFYTKEHHTYNTNVKCEDYTEETPVYQAEQILLSRIFTDDNSEAYYAGSVNFYDSVGNLKVNWEYDFESTDASNNYKKYVTKYYHDNHDRLVKATDHEGHDALYTYDGFNRPLTVTDSEGNVYTYVYDSGNRTVLLKFKGFNEETDRLLLKQEADIFGNVIKQTAYPDNSEENTLSEQYEYDISGNMTSYTDPNGNETTYVYDKASRLTETVMANGVKTTASYSAFNTPITEKIYDANGTERMLRQSFTNLRGDITKQTVSYDGVLADSNHYRTDAKGRTVLINEGENVKTLEYDESDNPVTVTSGQNKIHRRYNWYGEISALSENGNVTETAYGYDARGNLDEKMQDSTHYMSYIYSPIGQVTQSTMPSGRTEDYTYTDNGNLETITSEGKTFTYTYYDTGSIKSIEYPNGLKTTYTYDNINRVTGIATTSGTTSVNTFEYEYDANGNITKEIRNGKATSYTYDSINRLSSVTYSDTSSVTYEYDALNNKTKETYSNGDVKDFVYNGKYQLAEVKLNGTITDTFTYNISGAVITHNGETFTYDEWDKLTGYTNGTDNYTYKYDANGIRTQKNDKQYVVDANSNVVAEADSTGAITDEILWGHQPLARKTNGSWYYYIYNAHGDVVALISDDGEIENTYEYNPWGEIREETETVDNPIKYAGEYYDDELQMYYLRARYYSPAVGRFISEDPVRDGINWYVYANNNPLKYVDPTGESAMATAIVIVGPAVIDAAATAIVYGFTGRNIGAGLVNGFVEGLTTSIATYIGGVPGAIIGGTLGSALGSMSEDLLFNKNKSVEEIAISAAESAAWGLAGSLTTEYIDLSIDMANEAGSAAKTLMKYDEKFGNALKVFFEQLVNILSSQ